MLYIAYTKKVLKSNLNLIIILTPNLNETFTTLWNFFGNAAISKQRMCQLLRNLPNFLRQPSTYDITIS